MTLEIPDPLDDVDLRRQFAIVSSAARGAAVKRIMANTGCDPQTIDRVAKHFGAPHLGKLATAADKLRSLTVAAHQQTRADAGLSKPRPTVGDAGGVELLVPVTDTTIVSGPSINPALIVRGIEQLRDRATAAHDRRVANRADAMLTQLQCLLDDLHTAEITHEEATARRTVQLAAIDKARKAAADAARKAATEKEKADKLAAELYNLDQAERKQCRDWARANGRGHQVRGKIPKMIIDAWTEAGRP